MKISVQFFDSMIEKSLLGNHQLIQTEEQRWDYKRSNILTYIESDYYTIDLLENPSLKEEIESIIADKFRSEFLDTILFEVTFHMIFCRLEEFENKVSLQNEGILYDWIYETVNYDRRFHFIDDDLDSILQKIIQKLNIKFKN